MKQLHPLLAVCCVVLSTACGTQDPTTVLVENAYVVEAGQPPMTIYRVWWATSLFDEPLASSASSTAQRGVPATEFAYALVAPGWVPLDSAVPTRLIALKSKQRLTAERGELLQIRVSPLTFDGDCGAGSPLSRSDGDLITRDVFPGAFADSTYDVTTRTVVPTVEGSPDAGSQTPSDGGTATPDAMR